MTLSVGKEEKYMKLNRKSVRNVIIARNTVDNMGKGDYYKNPFGMKYLNEMAGEVVSLANRTHPHLAYYLLTRTI